MEMRDTTGTYLAVMRCCIIETDEAKYHDHNSGHARKRVDLKKGEIDWKP
jgi:hypothetical protein